MALSMANITKAGSTIGSSALSAYLTPTEKSLVGPRAVEFTAWLDTVQKHMLAGIRLG